MTEDSIAWLLRIQESEEEEETPELPELRDVLPMAGRAPAGQKESAAQPAARPEEADAAPAAGDSGRRTEVGTERAAREEAFTEGPSAARTFSGAGERDALLARRLYRSLVQAERSVKLAFLPAAAGVRSTAAAVGAEESVPTMWTAAGPTVSFHLNGLDARTMDEWFSRDARRYDTTDLG